MPLLYSATQVIETDTTDELPSGDYSPYRLMSVRMLIPAPGALVGDTLDIYVQKCDQSGQWTTICRSPQFLGNGAAQDKRYVISSLPPFSQTEESGSPPGPSPLTEPDADSVVNGPFPSIRYAVQPNPGGQAGLKSPAANLRVVYDRGGTAEPGFTPSVYIDGILDNTFP